MFTRVFYYGLGYQFTRSVVTPNIIFKNYLGDSQTITANNLRNAVSYFQDALNSTFKDGKSAVTNTTYCIAFGNGNNTPTIDDYQLSGDHFTTFTESHSFTYSTSSDAAIVTVTYTLTNTGDVAFTIKEAGVFIDPQGSAKTHRCLMWREVLDSPVTIEPGSVGQVTLTFKVNIPEA